MALHNQHKAIGHLGAGADGVKATMACNSAGGSGRGMTLTRVTGLGEYMPENLSEIVIKYEEQVKEDRRAAAIERRKNRGVKVSELASNY